ncbi:MAG: VCBS repeat-containing protein, partial [Acidobacteriota bacterium]|nr:VCBS repeat-containing protein [Acidobacteriota bacterium]
MRLPKSALSRRLHGRRVARRVWRPFRLATTAGAVLAVLAYAAAALHGRSAGPPGKEALASHRKMLQALKELRDRIPDRDPVLGDFRARHLRAELEELEAGRKKAGFFPQVARWRLHFDLGREELQLGNEQRSLEHSGAAFSLLPEVENLLRADLPIRLRFQLGVSHLRVGETQNCCLRANPDSCILPIREGGIHTEPEGSRQAIRYFTQVLERSASDSIAYLESRWLLNIAHMTLGSYPEGVPRAYLIPPKTFESDAPIPRFHNIAADLGLDTFNLAGSACADDFNNDGTLDLVVSTWDPAGQMRFFVNQGDGSFADRTREAGLSGLLGGINLLQADYDNDGYVDLLVLRGGWLGDSDRHPNSLLRNNGDGTFTDVTFLAGLGEVHFPTQTASWADYDNDGDLDLYIGNESTRKGIFLPQPLGEVEDDRLPFPCQLFRNNGDGTFSDVARQAGVSNDRWTKGVIWADYD